MKERCLLASLVVSMLAIPTAADGVPLLMNNQGVMRTAAGTPVADGKYDLAFALYDTETGGTPFWLEQLTGVQVQGGFYSVLLGEVSPLPADIFRKHPDVWVGVTFGTGPELPRRRVVSLAFAFEAGHAMAATAADVATDAKDLSCTGCVGTEELGFDLCEKTKTCNPLAGLTCAKGQFLKFDGDSWNCGEETTYAAGPGLTLNGTTFAVKQSQIEDWSRLVCYDTPDELKAVLAGLFAPTMHMHAGSDILSPVAQSLEAANALALEGKTIAEIRDSVLDEVAKAGYLTKDSRILEAQLPPNGLDDVSNGLITNQFFDTVAATDTPVEIPDNNPYGTQSFLTFPDLGIVEDLTVNLHLTNSDTASILVKLYDPDGIEHTLWNKNQVGTVIQTAFPKPTPVISGDLGHWAGKNPKGNWKLFVVDSGFKDNKKDGAIESWSITVRTMSGKKVRLDGDIEIKGNASVGGGITVSGGLTVAKDLTVSGALKADLDFGLNQAKRMRLQNAEADPVPCDANAVGMAYYNTKNAGLYVCNGAQFVRFALATARGTQNNPGRSCKDILASGGSVGDGVYWIRPLNKTFQVYCDMTTDGGGWTLAAFKGSAAGSAECGGTAPFDKISTPRTDFGEDKSKGCWSMLLRNNLVDGGEPFSEMAITLDNTNSTIAKSEATNQVVYYSWTYYRIDTHWQTTTVFFYRTKVSQGWTYSNQWGNQVNNYWFPLSSDGKYLILQQKGSTAGWYWGEAVGGNNSGSCSGSA